MTWDFEARSWTSENPGRRSGSGWRQRNPGNSDAWAGEWRRREASVAVIDADGDPATSPQTLGSGFHCDNCPLARVKAFFVFPRSEIGKADPENAYPIIKQIERVGNGLRVYVPEVAEGATVIHLLSPQLGIHTMEPSDLYRHEHERLERTGQTTHPFLSCPDRSHLREVRVWRPDSGWTTDTWPDSSIPQVKNYRSIQLQ